MWLLSTAFAGGVFLNEVQVNPADLAGMQLTGVTVTADAQGNLYLQAPGYSVKPVQPTVTPAPAPGPLPVPLAPMPGSEAVAPGAWWLYAEDQASVGHLVEVIVNGVVVTTVRSGQAPVILDLQKWLKPGANRVECVATSTNATGGPLYVYLGRGQDQNGTVNMGTPDIQFGVGSSRVGTTRRDYTLEVQ